MSFKTDDSSSTVISLPVHLENEQFVTFNEGGEEAAVKNARKAMLQASFELNSQLELESNETLAYLDVPLSYIFDNKHGIWKKRIYTSNLITRIHTVSPRDRERFALRLLLQHVSGPKSFNDLKIVAGTQYSIFNEAAQAYALVVNTQIWHNTMTELCRSSMPARIRSAFALILAYNNPPNAHDLFYAFRPQMIVDYLRNDNMDLLDAQERLLVHIERILNANNTSLSQFFGIATPLTQSMREYEEDADNGQTEALLSNSPVLNSDQ